VAEVKSEQNLFCNQKLENEIKRYQNKINMIRQKRRYRHYW